jgi:hypothetical protein
MAVAGAAARSDENPMRLVVGLFLAAAALEASAGGSSFSCRFDGFEEATDGHYVLIVRLLERLDIDLPLTAYRTLILHIEHSSRKTLPSGNRPVSREDFRAVIAEIRSDFNAGRVTRLGYMGSAFRHMAGARGHYRVFGIRIDEELTDDHKGTRRTLYAY